MIAIAEAEPCQLCKTRRGPFIGGVYQRLDARKFGGPGCCCRNCYQRFYRAARGRFDRPPPPPCAKCGTTGGPVRPGHRGPVRHDGGRFGVAGKVCDGCFAAHYRDRRHAERMAQATRTEAPPDPGAIRREATAILEEIASSSRAVEVRRVAEALAASRWATPAIGARRALSEFKATCFGPTAFPPPPPRARSAS